MHTTNRVDSTSPVCESVPDPGQIGHSGSTDVKALNIMDLDGVSACSTGQYPKARVFGSKFWTFEAGPKNKNPQRPEIKQRLKHGRII